VTTNYDFWDHIPMYDAITQEMIVAKIPPLPFMSYDTTDDYHIPMSYLKHTLFEQTAQGLVQGILTVTPHNTTQQMSIASTFGTSQPALLYIVLGICFYCALTATVANWSARHVAPMNLMRILAISRNLQLDTVFGRYSDRKVPMDEEMLNVKVGYRRIDSLERHALVLSDTPTSSRTRVVSSENSTSVYEVEYDRLWLLNSKY